MSNILVFSRQSWLPIWLCTFCSRLIKSLRLRTNAVWLLPFEAVQFSQEHVRLLPFSWSSCVVRPCTMGCGLSWTVVTPCLAVKPHPDRSLVLSSNQAALEMVQRQHQGIVWEMGWSSFRPFLSLWISIWTELNWKWWIGLKAWIINQYTSSI